MHSPRDIGRMTALLLWRSLALVLSALGAVASLAWQGHTGWGWLLTAVLGGLVAVGLDSPAPLRPHHLQRRVSATRVQPFSQLHAFLEPGELLRPGHVAVEPYGSAWSQAQAVSFIPAPQSWPNDTVLADLERGASCA